MYFNQSSDICMAQIPTKLWAPYKNLSEYGNKNQTDNQTHTYSENPTTGSEINYEQPVLDPGAQYNPLKIIA